MVVFAAMSGRAAMFPMAPPCITGMARLASMAEMRVMVFMRARVMVMLVGFFGQEIAEQTTGGSAAQCCQGVTLRHDCTRSSANTGA